MKKPYKFIISGGGTGGHIYPAIAIADALKVHFPGAEFLFVGAKDRMEMEKVPQAGYAIKGLWISGIDRKLTFRNMLFPIKLLSSLWRSCRILKSFSPHLVIGTGGFASGPLLYISGVLKIPTMIQEQNSYPGITNKLLAKRASKIFVAYDGLDQFFSKKHIVKTGNPVRQDLLQIETKRDQAIQVFGLNTELKTVLVIGGSLGAKRINTLIASKLDVFKKQELQVMWQCGALYYDTYKDYESETIKVSKFINQMDLAYAAADVIISRSGASSVSELCVVGKPVVFIPSPNVTDNHQVKNAKAIVKHNAAIMIEEKDLDVSFESTFLNLMSSVEQQKQLSNNIKKQALSGASETIVNEIAYFLDGVESDK